MNSAMKEEIKNLFEERFKQLENHINSLNEKIIVLQNQLKERNTVSGSSSISYEYQRILDREVEKEREREREDERRSDYGYSYSFASPTQYYTSNTCGYVGRDAGDPP
jgi:hypothetical protein